MFFQAEEFAKDIFPTVQYLNENLGILQSRNSIFCCRDQLEWFNGQIITSLRMNHTLNRT